MRNYWINLCFKRNSLHGKDYKEIIMESLNFKPSKFKHNKTKGGLRKWSEKLIDKIEHFDSSDTIYLSERENEGNTLHITNVIADIPYQAIYWVFSEDTIFNYEFLYQLIKKDGFIIGYSCDEEDEYFQSASFISDYQIRNKSYEGLKMIYNDDLSTYVIDISKNPGRYEIVQGVKLMSCWRMWFGIESYKVINKCKLLDFPFARDIKAIDDKVVFVELYENPFDANLPQNRKLQKEFRDWLDFDGIINNCRTGPRVL